MNKNRDWNVDDDDDNNIDDDDDDDDDDEDNDDDDFQVKFSSKINKKSRKGWEILIVGIWHMSCL